nr:LapA family protein [Pseudomonas sp. TH39(2020)]
MLLLLALLLALLTAIFVLENQQSVSINFYGFSSLGLPLSACLIIAVLLGMVIGPLMRLAFGFRRKTNVKRKI